MAVLSLFLVSSGAGSSDPFWSSVLLLLGNNQGPNGVDVTNDPGSNAPDQSNYLRPVTRVGTPTWSNATPPAGLTTWVNFAAGTEGVVVPDSADWQFAGDFCIELWFDSGAIGTFRTIFGIGDASGGSDALSVNMQPTGGTSDLGLFAGTTPNGNEWNAGGVSVTTLSANTNYYVAVYRSGSNLYLAYNTLGGNTLTPIVVNASATGTLANVTSGAFFGGNSTTVGMVSEAGPYRITGGQARYGAVAYAIPTLPLPTATT